MKKKLDFIEGIEKNKDMNRVLSEKIYRLCPELSLLASIVPFHGTGLKVI
jgi:hypothetical protein